MARDVLHLGPDPGHVGGIGTVMTLFAEHRIGGSVTIHPTYIPGRRLTSMVGVLRALRRIRRLPEEAVVHVHLSHRGAFVREGATVLWARRARRTTVVTIHGSGFVAFARRRPRLAGGVLRRADAAVCLTEEAGEAVRRLSPETLCEVIPNPVVVDRESGPAGATPELVLFAGEVGARKGADVLDAAWDAIIARRPNAKCVIVGPPTDLAIRSRRGLEVREPVGRRELRDLLRSARVVVLPSRAEAMPMILLEAMGAGRPFVATPVGDVPALAGDGGTLVPLNDAAALADALVSYLADPRLAQEVGERGRERCARERGIERVSARISALYERAATSA